MVPIRCGERRNGIGSVLSGRMVFMKIPGKKPPLRPGACSWSQSGSGKFKGRGRVQGLASRKPGKIKGMAAETKPPRCPEKGRRRPSTSGKTPKDPDNQLLRRPSAARFHCDTLSAIMRVDFIAA
jgi:hypothetical protein